MNDLYNQISKLMNNLYFTILAFDKSVLDEPIEWISKVQKNLHNVMSNKNLDTFYKAFTEVITNVKITDFMQGDMLFLDFSNSYITVFNFWRNWWDRRLQC